MTVSGSLRLLVRTDKRGNAGELTLSAALTMLGPDADWEIERLFPNDVVDDDCFVVVATFDASLSPADAFVVANALAAEPGIAEVEPDLPIPQYPTTVIDPGVAAGAFEPAPPTAAQLAWARDNMRCGDAWALPLPAGGKHRGKDILIGHPDTGYSTHTAFGPNLVALDLVRDRDFVDDDDDAIDPMRKSPIPLSRFPAHGTGTASVIVGRGPEGTGVLGVAPEATLVPLRAVNTVIQLFDSDVARAVDHARSVGCHVISMSLGGKGFFGLHRAIQRAVESGMIVLAASGNYVQIIVAPASYDNCIAVAATGPKDVPWEHSSHGKDIEISAPGAAVYGAAWHLDETPRREFISTKEGTSFAVAHVAGVAALWLAHHGRAALLKRYPGARLQAVFRSLLKGPGKRVPAIPGGWKSNEYGPGVIDAHGLLSAALPDPAAFAPAGAFATTSEPPSGVDRIAAAFPTLSRSAVKKRLATGGLTPAQADALAPEILYHLLAHPDLSEQFADVKPTAQGAFERAENEAFAPAWVGRLRADGSPALADALD